MQVLGTIQGGASAGSSAAWVYRPSHQTDSRHAVANLPAGRYSINASKNGFLSLSYGQTRPTTPPLTLTLADKQNADDINLLLLRGGAIAGHVLDDFGDPVSGVTVTALRSQFQSLRANARPPVAAPGAAAVPPTPPPPPEWVVAVVTVVGEDINGVRLAPVSRVTAKGRIVFADTAASASLKPMAIRINTQILSPDDSLAATPTPTTPSVKEDFRTRGFSRPDAVASHSHRASRRQGVPAFPGVAASLAAQGVLKSLRVNGVGRGEPAATHIVLVFAQDRDLWTMPGPGRPGMIRTDQAERFMLRNIRPGRYYGVALAELNPTSWTNPEFLQTLTARATFSMTEGESKTLGLRVDTRG